MQDTREGPARPVAMPAPEPVAPAATPPQARAKPPKLTRREARRQRRKTRKRYEEILAWIVVPLICIGLYWAAMATFDFFGTDPGTVWDQLQQVRTMLQKKYQADNP